MDRREQVKQAMAQFPEVFGLRPFPGGLFTINESASFVDGHGVVQLYVFTEKGLAFSKGTVEELEGVICR